MKKILVVLAVACMVLSAAAAQAKIAGSAHDMTSTTLGMAPGVAADPCIYCHTPHGGGSFALWNRLAKTAITGTYVSTANPTGNTLDARGSMLCLSCHDGVLTETMLNAPGRNGQNTSVTFNPITKNALAIIADVSSDLANDHPIAVTLPATGYAAPTWAVFYDGSGNRTAAANGRVECGTCHDPHTGVDYGTTPGFTDMMLRTGFKCGDCHNSK
ncbi:MAG: hypothetical protein M0042_07875 [Nitrospiraceae bacterium]|nr:hypothetical protein [Nitrospiraceae bacterium]